MQENYPGLPDQNSDPFTLFNLEETEQSVSSCFEHPERRYSKRIAVKSTSTNMTNEELNREAEQVVFALLRPHKAREGAPAILLEHEAPVIAAILGVLKAGIAFLVLDPGAPLAINREI